MSEQAVQETGAPAEAPEVVNAAPEIPQDTPEIPAENTPEIPVEQAQQSETDIYQDVLAKHKADPTFEMSDEQSEAFLSVLDKVASGEIEEPGSKKQEVPEEPKNETPEADTENSTGDTPENTENQADVGINLSDDNAGKLQKAMTLVGAKDIGELDDKISGLLKQMTSSGGKLGTELKQLQDEKANHVQWMNDLKAGKPEAKAYLSSIMGETNQSVNTQDSNLDQGYDVDEFYDDKLAPIVLSQKKIIEDLTSKVDKLTEGDATRSARAQRETAANGWIDDIVDLVTGNETDFGLSASEARALSKDYWGPDGHTKAVHPKFQQLHELIIYANDKGYPDLNTAHVMYQHENGAYAQKLVEAAKDGQKSKTYKPSVNGSISNQQGRQQAKIPDAHIDDDAVSKMERGDWSSIPDEWVDENGTFIKENVPQRFHKKIFGVG